MIKRIKDYIYDKEYKIIQSKNQLNIINYINIITLTDNFIEIKTKDNVIAITGKELVLNKLLDNEILIIGIISKIEVL